MHTKFMKHSTINTECIPGGVNSPVRSFQGLGVPPLMVERGEGAYFYDIEGKAYLDFCMSWGALILGHADKQLLKATFKRMEKGSSFGLTTPIEHALAEQVVSMIPSIEQVRFVSSGTEATMSAVRLARGYTGKNVIIKFDGHYHGHSDQFLIKAGSGVHTNCPESSSAGIPKEMVAHTRSIPFNDLESLKQALRGQDVAAVIMEPIPGNMGVVPPMKGYLEQVRELTDTFGALLIFDEVISGFRVARGGAQELYQINPDLTCLGKIVGGGFPAAAFGGKRAIMEWLAPNGPVYQAGTLSGNPIAMEAGLYTLKRLDVDGVYEMLNENGAFVAHALRKLLADKNLKGCVNQVGAMFTLFFGVDRVSQFSDLKHIDKNRFSHLFRELLKRGIYLSPSPHEAHFISLCHTKEHLETLIAQVSCSIG